MKDICEEREEELINAIRSFIEYCFPYLKSSCLVFDAKRESYVLAVISDDLAHIYADDIKDKLCRFIDTNEKVCKELNNSLFEENKRKREGRL